MMGVRKTKARTYTHGLEEVLGVELGELAGVASLRVGLRVPRVAHDQHRQL